MSRPATLPIRLASQCAKRPALQCLRQQSPYNSLDSTPRQWPPTSKRAFSAIPARRANGSMNIVKPSIAQKAQPSQSRTQKEEEAAALRSGKFPEDIGLLPETLILPRGAGRWKWSMRKKWVKTRALEFASWFAYRWWVVKPRPSNVEVLGTRQIAADLHKNMYTAFAAGSLAPVSHLLTQGILGSLRGRIAQRPANTYLHWRLIKHLSSPKLVSYRAVHFPGPKDETAQERNVQVQAVVRLHTKQSLQHVRRVQRRINGKLVEEESATESPQEKESVEYVVVQKAMRKGRWGEWMLWGFANEANAEKVEREHQAERATRKGSRASA